MTDQAAVILQVADAFAGDPPWDGGPPIRPDSAGEPRIAGLLDGLRGVHWRDVPFPTLDELRTAVPFLSPAAYRYLLPAFLAYSVTDPDRAGTLLDDLVLSLTPATESDLDELVRFAETAEGASVASPAEWADLLASRRGALRDGTDQTLFAARVAGLTGRQRAAVRAWLERLRDVYGDDFPAGQPGTALDRYWSDPPGSGRSSQV